MAGCKLSTQHLVKSIPLTVKAEGGWTDMGQEWWEVAGLSNTIMFRGVQ